ncbi:hypothetical protein L917_14353 [Phytophthora nicotianae]|uniref:Uncharacterized protein n=1 Tax=Phytophthora nicotianae TaxID=4792 RepID=W2KPC9_PHYNI|nr:hypothetical protein L917_14353 [Phytophthora nicotianae]
MGMSGFVDEVSLNIYLWMRWVIQRNLPITEVKNKLTREAVTIKSTTVRTMKVCMRYVTATLSNFLSIFTVYLMNGMRYQWLLALSPMYGSQTADTHIEHIESVLNVWTNLFIQTKLKVPLNGCSSNRFNTAINRVLDDYQNQINMIQTLTFYI